LLRRSRPLHGDERGNKLRAVRLPARGVNLRVDRAGPDGIDAYAFLRHLACQPDGKAVDGALGGRIVDIFASGAENRRHGGYIDDGAALAAVPCRHALDRLARAKDGADHVDAHHALESSETHLFHARLHVHHAGIVDERVERPVTLVHGLEDGKHIGLAADIALYRDGLAAFLPDLAADHLRGRSTGDMAACDPAA